MKKLIILICTIGLLAITGCGEQPVDTFIDNNIPVQIEEIYQEVDVSSNRVEALKTYQHIHLNLMQL